jgi:ribosomal subunit interface protein
VGAPQNGIDPSPGTPTERTEPTMQSTQITLRNIGRSPALSARIRELSERLERHHPGIVHCRVAVTHEPGTRKGRLYTVSVQVRIPGREIAGAHQDEDVYVALHETFDAMRRQLFDIAEAAREAKRPPGTIAEAQT